MRKYIKYQIFFIFLLSSVIFSQIRFVPEFAFYKINPKDSLMSFDLFDENKDGKDEIIASYQNSNENILRIIKYSSNGTLLYHKEITFPFVGLVGKSAVFSDGQKDYLAEAVSMYNSLNDPINYNFLVMQIYDLSTLSLVDTKTVYIGQVPNNPDYGYFHFVEYINFFKTKKSVDGLKLYLGINIEDDNTMKKIDYPIGSWDNFSKLYTFGFTSGKLTTDSVYDKCGRGILLTEGPEIISWGHFKNYTLASYNEGSYHQYIISINEQQRLIKTLFDQYGKWNGYSKSFGAQNYIDVLEGITNNYPSQHSYSPLFLESIRNYSIGGNRDTIKVFAFSDNFQSYSFNKLSDSVNNMIWSLGASTNLLLRDGSPAALYFYVNMNTANYSSKKDTLLRITKIKNGELVLSQKTNFYPFAIVKGSNSILYGINKEANGYVFYSLYSDLILTDVNKGNSNSIKLFELSQNYPNPFNPKTTISYSIPKESLVDLKVYDMLGREVSTLVNIEQEAGTYKVLFDGSNLPSGLYIYAIKAGQFKDSKKLILIK